MTKLCPFRTITTKETIKDGLKLSVQDFCTYGVIRCAAFNPENNTCVMTQHKREDRMILELIGKVFAALIICCAVAFIAGIILTAVEAMIEMCRRKK